MLARHFYGLSLAAHHGGGSEDWGQGGMTGHDDLHWHGYTRVAAAPAVPTLVERAIRLSAEPEAVLTSPTAVGRWVAQRVRGRGSRFELWLPEPGRWMTYEAGDWPSLGVESALRAEQARSVYAAVWSTTTTNGSRFEVYAEAVSSLECPVRGDHLDGRRQR